MTAERLMDRPSGPTFRERGTLEYLAFKDSVLFRIKHVPVEKK